MVPAQQLLPYIALDPAEERLSGDDVNKVIQHVHAVVLTCLPDNTLHIRDIAYFVIINTSSSSAPW